MMTSHSVFHTHFIQGTSATEGGQTFAGVNHGTINYAGRGNKLDANEQAAIACRKALFLTDPYVDRECLISAKGTRVAGTCEWILHHENYRAWLNGDDSKNGSTSRLWISGGPGKGKTMISVFLTEELEKHVSLKRNQEVIFFFCSAEDEKRSTAVAVLRGLVHQIITKRPQLVKHALEHFKTPERAKQTLDSLETLWIIFSKLVADTELGTMFCVLDGLDECEESTLRKMLPRITGDVLSSSKSAFNLAIVSRHLSGLEEWARIKLDPDNDEKVDSDIKLFVSARVAELSRIQGFNRKFRKDVEQTLLDRAQGTFLWAGFAMYEFSQKRTCSDIWEALQSLPPGLPAIYSRMLLQIPPRKRNISREILQWVTMAVRPLKLKEVAAAVSIQAISSEITQEQATRDAITCCGPLLQVKERVVSLVHQSARDYLLRKEQDSNDVLEEFRLRIEPSHLELAKKCLDCITNSDLWQEALYSNQLDLVEPPLLQYAVLHWPEHAKSCGALATRLFDPAGLFFRKKSWLRDRWWTLYEEKLSFYPDSTLLHLACGLEIVPWVEAVLAKKRWLPWRRRLVNRSASGKKTALQWAARNGNEAIVWLLIERKANVNAKDMFGLTALHYAAINGDHATIQLLLDQGAKIRAKDCDGNTALHYAARTGNKAIGKLLLERGMDVNAKNEDGETALHRAAYYGHYAMVQLLLNRGGEANAVRNDGMTVLHDAASSGISEVVQVLMDHAADLKAVKNDGTTVLHRAALGKNSEVVQLLVDLGADFNAVTNDGTTVLHEAASRGNSEAVQLLVDRGADVNAVTNDGRTVLHEATHRDAETTRLLVRLGANIKAADNRGNTVLHSAMGRSVDREMVQQLVDLGVDVYAKNNGGSSALDTAIYSRVDHEVIQLLEELGTPRRNFYIENDEE